MKNVWIKQVYMQVLYVEFVTFKQVVNIFDIKWTAENIYEEVIYPPHKKLLSNNPPIMVTAGIWGSYPPR